MIPVVYVVGHYREGGMKNWGGGVVQVGFIRVPVFVALGGGGFFFFFFFFERKLFE